MTNKTIETAERELYLALIQRAQYRPIATQWLANLPQWLSDVKDKRRYAHAPAYLSAVENLQKIEVNGVDLNSDVLTIEAQLNEGQSKQITALMKQLIECMLGIWPHFSPNNWTSTIIHFILIITTY